MDHVALMRAGSGFLQKIIQGQKTIESRWYLTRRAPYSRISAGDTVYFMERGLVQAKAQVKSVVQEDGLTPERIRQLLALHGKGLGIADVPAFSTTVKDKRYCILVFLKGVEKTTHFRIDKKGYGNQCAWISIPDITTIKIT